jgi:hypothetical protein
MIPLTQPTPCTLILACEPSQLLNLPLCLLAISPHRPAESLQVTLAPPAGPCRAPLANCSFCLCATPSHLSACHALSPPSPPCLSLMCSTQTGRTPADYVDPRLPGLSELLEAGRQLTPSRAPSAAAARTAHHHGSGASSAAGSGGKHRSSPFPSPGGPHHPSGHHPTTIGAFRAAGGSPGPGGARPRGGSGVVSPAGGQGGHKQQQQQYGTPQGRRSSSTYSSWDTSPSQVRWRGV